MYKPMKKLLAILSVVLFANQASAEKIYVLITFYVLQSDLADAEAGTSIVRIANETADI